MKRLTVAEIAARTAERKAAGANQTYPRHAARPAKRAPKRTAPGAPAAMSPPVLPACSHEGAVLVPCHSCGAADRHVRDCALHGQATRVDAGKDVDMVCARCPDHTGRRASPVLTAPSAAPGVTHIDHTTLFPGLPGKRFNAALHPSRGGYVYSWRDGWAGSDIWACRMDAQFAPVGPAVRLELTHPEADYGREDPQLFEFAGALHVAYVGVVSARGRVQRTAVLYARLSDGLRVERIFAPRAPGVPVARWQKNWQWFESGGALYAVYSVSPHKVLRVDGDRAEWAYESPFPWRWAGGELRGGATPVRVGTEWWSFAHDSVVERGRKRYRVALYTFDAQPPFAPRRYVPAPILAADPSTNVGPDRNYCDVLFPRGAVRASESEWVLSSGVHDRWAELRGLSHAGLDAAIRGRPA